MNTNDSISSDGVRRIFGFGGFVLINVVGKGIGKVFSGFENDHKEG